MVSYHSDQRPFHLIAEVSSDCPTAIGPVLEQLVGGTVTETPEGFHVDCWMEGTDSRELNRELLSSLRRVERRTRLRAEWTANGERSVLRLRAKGHTSSIAGPIWKMTGFHVLVGGDCPGSLALERVIRGPTSEVPSTPSAPEHFIWAVVTVD
jgi:hypothetical protein